MDQTGDVITKESPLEVVEPVIEIPSQAQLVEDETESVTDPDDDVEMEKEHCNDIEWTPASLHLRRNLRNDKTTDDIAYNLLFRVVSRSRPEPRSDTARTVANDVIGNDIMQDFTFSDAVQNTAGHSYNLNRTGRMSADTKAE